jgi:hypothetical protein
MSTITHSDDTRRPDHIERRSECAQAGGHDRRDEHAADDRAGLPGHEPARGDAEGLVADGEILAVREGRGDDERAGSSRPPSTIGPAALIAAVTTARPAISVKLVLMRAPPGPRPARAG